MITWNGTDTNVFLGILACVERKETVEVSMQNGVVITVSAIEDMRSLLPPRNAHTELTRQEYEEILRVFMPSKEMREFLLTKELGRCQVMDLMLGAPVSLETKAEYCRRLACRDDIFHSFLDEITSGLSGEHNEPGGKKALLELFAEYSFTGHERAIRAALDALKLQPGEILLLREAWYDEDDAEDNESSSSLPLQSFEAALRYIRDEMKEEEWDDETKCWTVLEKWAPRDNGEMNHLYTYYLIREEIIFFEEKERSPWDRWFWHTKYYDYSDESRNLNLPIPYQPGDIVTVNCLPFAPVKHVLLLEVENDCCGVSALFRREDGKWDTGALKHGRCWGAYRPMLSPLYRIRSHNRKMLFRDEEVLFSVQKYIAGDAEKGRSLWDAFYRSDSDGQKEKELFVLVGDTHGDDVLLEYKDDCRICSSDVSKIWPWNAVDTEVKLNHTNDEELVFTLFNPGRDENKVVFWDKTRREIAWVAKGRKCYDAIRFAGHFFTLNIIEEPNRMLRIAVDQWDDQSQSEFGIGIPLCYKAIDSSDRWADLHLAVENDRLFVILNGKRFAEAIPELVRGIKD